MAAFRPSKLPRATTLPPLAELFDDKSTSTMPRAGALTAVEYHQQWLESYAAAAAADVGSQHATRYREATRFIAVSQAGAGAWLDVAPDGDFSTTVTSPLFVVMLQRRLGLQLSEATGIFDAEERDGMDVDRLGDGLANAGEYSRRHNACLRAIRDMIAAVAIGQVVLGDKEDAARTAFLNEGHVVDIAEIGGDEDTGADVLYEVKCKSALKQHFSCGHGSATNGGAPASMGCKIGFGSTEEEERVRILGCKERGLPRDGPMNHTSGKGWVAAKKGDYHDALVNKRSRVIPAVIESTGGLSPPLRAQMRCLEGRAKGAGASDRTKYGSTRASARSFMVHHTQRISLAAVKYDALAIRKKMLSKKQKLAAHAAPTDGAWA